MLEDEKKQMSEWEARHAFASSFRNTMEVRLVDRHIATSHVVMSAFKIQFLSQKYMCSSNTYYGTCTSTRMGEGVCTLTSQ